MENFYIYIISDYPYLLVFSPSALLFSFLPFQQHFLQNAFFVNGCQRYALKESEKVLSESEKLYKKLTKQGLDVLWDDRDARAGEKFADSDLIGIPRRIIVSEKTLGQNSYEEVERATGKSKLVKL